MDERASQDVDAILAAADDWRGEVLSLVRRVVLAADPAITDVKWRKPSRPEGVPVWSYDGILCIGEMLKRAVRVTFPKGALLEDSEHFFNARLTSASVRAIDIGEADELPEDALTALVLGAMRLNG